MSDSSSDTSDDPSLAPRRRLEPPALYSSDDGVVWTRSGAPFDADQFFAYVAASGPIDRSQDPRFADQIRQLCLDVMGEFNYEDPMSHLCERIDACLDECVEFDTPMRKTIHVNSIPQAGRFQMKAIARSIIDEALREPIPVGPHRINKDWFQWTVTEDCCSKTHGHRSVAIAVSDDGLRRAGHLGQDLLMRVLVSRLQEYGMLAVRCTGYPW